MPDRIKGLVFDKDGTLFDFQASWAPIYARIIEGIAGADADRRAAVAQAAGFDLAAGRFRPGSVLIAGTNSEVTAVLAPFRPDLPPGDLEAWLDREARAARLAPVTDLAVFGAGLRAAGLRLGVATNDSEATARAHLAQAGAAAHFEYVAGFDSGHGAKPGPGMVAAFCRATGLAPGAVAMVGDSTHDLHAARAAGVMAVAVLTGVASRADLAPHADHVLASIREIPAWLGAAA